ncbi:erythroblast NAD(P)(+)--arginine ADP-ribosyltransferase-like [Anabas testudineus]|uniref:erythroblast NAD(P)(+)--arginine ADP-ribosyltransferase-like n=1 Tax=Anabas testudineus TaxID=64144 RepID=UPI000E453D3A|nr:erythroblast NAD(P)(+)--arginine ADP-ribosyltransferase-like [Anabas testudineus]
MNLLLSASLCFLLCLMLPVDSMMVRLNSTSHDAKKPVPLGMAEDAVDDMYFGCNKTMAEMVKNKFFRKEMKEKTGTFADVWKRAESCANRKLKQRTAGDQALTKDHLQAICVFTSDDDDGDDDEGFYKTFNDAVRKNKKKYDTDFLFHSLHFWLTSAVQILSNNKKCHTTYRRTNHTFTGKRNNMMRFGSFASSSHKTTLVDFGNKTCFKITTCSGADLKRYSEVKGEEEVLIPPYEVFKITEKKKGGEVKELVGCKVVYRLESAGVLSNLNCKLTL